MPTATPNLRLIVVEDNPGDVDLICDALSRYPYGIIDVIAFGRLGPALENISQHVYDLAILDLSLPDCDKSESVLKLRATAEGLPIVVLTNNTDMVGGEDALRQGAQEYLCKTELDEQNLWRAIRYAMERQQLANERQRRITQSAALAVAERAQKRALLLADVSTSLGTCLLEAQNLQLVATSIAQRFGDWCIIAVPCEKTGASTLTVGQHVETSKAVAQGIRNFQLRDFAPPCPISEVIRSGRSQHGSKTCLGDLFGMQECDSILKEYAFAQAITVAIPGPQKPLGAVFFGKHTDAGIDFDADGLALGEEIGRCMAAAMSNARLYHCAQVAVGLRDDFLSIASHELRTPITTLQLQVQGCLRQVAREEAQHKASPDLKRKLTSAGRQVQKLSALVDMLLDATRLHAGGVTIHPERIDLPELLNGIIDEVKGQHDPEPGIDLQAQGQVFGYWDRLKIEQVCINLLSNACKYGGGSRIRVEISTDGGVTNLMVEDGGIGISAANIKRIFDRFERVSSACPGLGLGLYITRQIIEAHGGWIEASSEVGRGARFTVHLPDGSADTKSFSR